MSNISNVAGHVLANTLVNLEASKKAEFISKLSEEQLISLQEYTNEAKITQSQAAPTVELINPPSFQMPSARDVEIGVNANSHVSFRVRSLNKKGDMAFKPGKGHSMALVDIVSLVLNSHTVAQQLLDNLDSYKVVHGDAEKESIRKALQRHLGK